MLASSKKLSRPAQEPNRNRKPEPSEPFSQEPNAEPEPPEPFSRNRNRNRPLCEIVLKHRKPPSLEEPPEPKTGTARTVPSPNRNRTQPNRAPLSFPDRWQTQKKNYRNQRSHIYHRILSFVAVTSFGKEKFLTEARWMMYDFFLTDQDRVVADVWKKDVWEFQAKSGSSGSCRLFRHFLGKIAVQEMSGKTPGSPRHPSSRHPQPSDKTPSTLRTSCMTLLIPKRKCNCNFSKTVKAAIGL